ncbi:MAG: PAS domain S-box protein [Deltaproteobacteria bacterium]|nr:PAS domain S-box protein [Deltaproteobacteria bacterium]
MTHILIVEDHAESRYMLERLLASKGHRIVTAENGREALEMVRENPPEVIISDIMMPVMNGFKLCCEVKKDPALRQIPFIFYTATFVDESDRNLAMSLGASRFVIKPTEGETFLHILDEVLKEHQKGILPVPEAPLEDQEVLVEMYESSITRKLAETVEKLQDERRTLIQSEQRLKEAQELAHIGHWELDLKTDSLEWSDEIYRILREKPRAFDPSYETLITMEVIHPDDRTGVVRAHKESLRKNTPCDMEYRLLLKDGTLKYVNERFQTLFDDHGNPACVMGTVQDITERRQAEEGQREAEERRRVLFEEALDGICMADAQTGVILDCNQALADLVDRDREELIGNPQSILHPGSEEQADLSPTFRQHLTDKEGEIIETQVVTRRGAIKEVEIKANLVELRGRKTLQGIFRDLTGRRQAEEALRKSEARYRLLVENAGEVVMVAQNGRIEFLNRKVVDVLGYTPGELVGKPFVDFIHPEDSKIVLDRHMKRMRGEVLPEVYPFRVIDKEGRTKWVEINAVGIEWEGNPATLNFLEDIMARKEAEAEKEALQAQLNQARRMESIGILAGGVAHDFNNLLTTIMGNAQLALADLKKDNPLYEDMDEIRKAGERGTVLTRRLLAFSRKEVIHPEVLDLNALVQDMDKLLRRLLRENIELNTVLSPGLWKAVADPGQMEQVIMNLVVNARDAMPEGGKLTLETANTELDASYFRSHNVKGDPGSYVMLAVSDTGPGMDQETMARIFEPFFTTKARGAGTGLGLSTVYGILKQSGGYVWPYSQPGKGTTMKVYLPKAKDVPSPAKKERLCEAKAGAGEVVLVVEDDISLQELAVKTLRRAGYQVLAAANGEEALKVIKGFEGEIHLLLTDVIMPRMGGQELVERVRLLRPEIQVLYMSGYPGGAFLESGIARSDSSFVQKPFTPEALCRKVRVKMNNERFERGAWNAERGTRNAEK